MSNPKGKRKNGTSKAAAAERAARFVHAYLTLGENATRAYLDINPTVTYNTAAVEGHRLLKDPKIQKAIEGRRAEIRAQFSLTTDRVYQEHARISYFNPKRLLDANGKPIPLHKLDDDTAAALASVEITEVEVRGKGKNQVVTTRKVKGRPFNKPSTLREVSKILRLYDKPPPPPPDETPATISDRRETARRMAFLLASGAAAEEKAQAKATPKPRKKHTVAS